MTQSLPSEPQISKVTFGKGVAHVIRFDKLCVPNISCICTNTFGRIVIFCIMFLKGFVNKV
jgi:hypothetical protein